MSADNFPQRDIDLSKSGYSVHDTENTGRYTGEYGNHGENLTSTAGFVSELAATRSPLPTGMVSFPQPIRAPTCLTG